MNTKSQSSFELEAIAGGVRPRNDKNVRPGDRMGLTVQQVQNYIKRQKRMKGESFSLSAGDNTNQIQLPGTARVFLGFVLDVTNFEGAAAGLDPEGLVSLIINNEVVIEETYVKFLGPDFTDEEYYFIPRPLSGQDDIKLKVTGVTDTYTLRVNNYYL